MRRLIRIILWWIATSAVIVSILGIGYQCIRLNMLTEYNNTLYHNKAMIILFSRDGSEYVDLSGLKEHPGFDDCMLLRYAYDEYLSNELICFGKDSLAFAQGDAAAGEGALFAISGCDAGYECGDIAEYDNERYEVRAILQEHINPLVNRGTFFYKDDLTRVSTEFSYVLTSSDKGAIPGAFEALERICTGSGIDLKCIEIEETRYEDYIHFRELYRCLIGLFILYIVFVSVIHRIVWLRTRQRLFLVLDMFGISNIRSRDLLCYLSLVLISFISSVTFYVRFLQ